MKLYFPESVVSRSAVHIRQGSTNNIARGQTVSSSLSHKPSVYVHDLCQRDGLLKSFIICRVDDHVVCTVRQTFSALSHAPTGLFSVCVYSTPIPRLTSFRLCNVAGAFLVCNKSDRNILGPRLVSRPAGPNGMRVGTTRLID